MKKQISAKQRTETPLPPLNFWGFLRWTWRQLTSMNTALLLLLLVALAAIPGSILPQRTASILKVNNWKSANPAFADIFDSLGLFDVYGSFWFSAIYILLIFAFGILIFRYPANCFISNGGFGGCSLNDRQ